ncbi:MAG: tetratricopeptide repeat protein [Acidobacteriota bacterium]|nr:tetratricopeptide repeat protein [Acidobacteriota bacterium]
MKRSHRLVIIAASVTLMVVSAAGPATADWSAGLELYGQSRFAEAAEHFRATVTSNPHWPGGYLMLGRCQLALEQYDEALENLQKAAELGPDDPANVATLSRALMAVDRYADARVVLEGLDLEKLSPDWKAEVARMLARCLLVEDRTADAVAVLQERLIDDPDRAALHRAIAGAYQAAGDRAAALDHFERAFELDPDDRVSGHAAATTALALAADADDDDLAAAYYGRGLEVAAKLATVAPEYEHALLAGELAIGARQLEAAAGWFAAAVKEQPQEPMALFYLGRTLADLDHNDEATTQLRAALGAAPDDELAVPIHAKLGQLLACRLELPEAARHYRAAGDTGRADEIDELASGFAEALGRLATLRSNIADLVGMEAELEKLGDADGVTALASQRAAMGREMSGIEANLSEVRAALCQ